MWVQGDTLATPKSCGPRGNWHHDCIQVSISLSPLTFSLTHLSLTPGVGDEACKMYKKCMCVWVKEVRRKQHISIPGGLCCSPPVCVRVCMCVCGGGGGGGGGTRLVTRVTFFH